MDVLPPPESPYHCTLATVREMLAKFGVAVIPSLLDLEECTALYQQMWKDLSFISSAWARPINSDDPTTWNIHNFSATRDLIIQHHKIAHIQSAWDARQNPKVVEAFAALWGTRDLLTSFDGISINFPPEMNGKGWAKTHQWHTDQSYLYSYPQTTNPEPYTCVQGWVTPIEVREGDATLAFMEGSHLFHRHFGASRGITDKDNWYLLSDEEVNIYLNQYRCIPRRITCPPGSLVLWDSRTIHYGAKPERTRATPNIRMIVYVCMMPRSYATEKQLVRRRELFEQKRVCKHHPIDIHPFPPNPRKWSKDDVKEPMIEIPHPQLTDLGKRLAGY